MPKLIRAHKEIADSGLSSRIMLPYGVNHAILSLRLYEHKIVKIDKDDLGAYKIYFKMGTSHRNNEIPVEYMLNISRSLQVLINNEEILDAFIGFDETKHLWVVTVVEKEEKES